MTSLQGCWCQHAGDFWTWALISWKTTMVAPLHHHGDLLLAQDGRRPRTVSPNRDGSITKGDERMKGWQKDGHFGVKPRVTGTRVLTYSHFPSFSQSIGNTPIAGCQAWQYEELSMHILTYVELSSGDLIAKNGSVHIKWHMSFPIFYHRHCVRIGMQVDCDFHLGPGYPFGWISALCVAFVPEPGLQLVFLQGCRIYLAFLPGRLFRWLQVRWLFWNHQETWAVYFGNHPETSAVLSALRRSVFFPCRVLCIGMQVDCDFHNLLPLASWVGRDEPDVCYSFPLLDISIPSQGRKHQTEQVGNVCLHCVCVHMALEALISHMS